MSDHDELSTLRSESFLRKGLKDKTAAHLSDANLQSAQRRALADRIARVHGNQHLQRALPSQNKRTDDTFNIKLWGKDHRNLTKSQALRVLRDVSNTIRIWTTAEREGHKHLKRIRDDQWIVGWVSDTVGGVRMPPLAMWNLPLLGLQAAKSLLDRGSVMAAANMLQLTEDAYRDCHKRYYEYKGGTIRGAEIAKTGLEVTAAAGAVAAGVATGGAASAAGYGLVTASGAVALAGGGYGAAQETVTQAGEMIAGTREMAEYDWHAIWKRGSTDVIAGFVGGLAGGALAKGLFRLCPKNFNALPSQIFSRSSETNKALIEAGLEPILSPQALVPLWQKFGVEFLSSGAVKLLLEEPTKIVVNDLTTKQEFPTREQFLEKVTLRFLSQEALMLAFAGFVKGKL